MALSSESVKKAWYILHEINPNARNSFIQPFDEKEPLQEDTIIGYDKKNDGWENVFMNVKKFRTHLLLTIRVMALRELDGFNP